MNLGKPESRPSVVHLIPFSSFDRPLIISLSAVQSRVHTIGYLCYWLTYEIITDILKITITTLSLSLCVFEFVFDNAILTSVRLIACQHNNHEICNNVIVKWCVKRLQQREREVLTVYCYLPLFSRKIQLCKKNQGSTY